MAASARPQRVKPKTGYHHGDLRQQLIVAARRLVDKHGADGFRLADAATLAGVSTAAPYRHFKDRDALLLAVSVDGFERLGAEFAGAADARKSGSVETIAALGGAYVGFAQANAHMFRLMFSTTRVGEDGPTETGSSAYAILTRHVAAHLTLPVDAAPVLATALSLWMYVHGFASLLIDDKLGIGRLEIDIEAMLRANTGPMLRAFVPS